ncbi:MAG TPA: hypothetical protein VN155_05430, partial [Devosia sp.]|nr:hypothetical protein [Devosia sp.]
FASTAERNGFLYDFVDAYNRTRLKAIGYIAPKQALDNQTELYTKAGIHAEGHPGAGCVRIATDMDSGLRRNGTVDDVKPG